MNTMTTDLITALQTHGQLHKGTDLGGILHWAILHIQSQDEALAEALEELAASEQELEQCRRAISISQAAMHTAISEMIANTPVLPIEFARDYTSQINLMGALGDADYMKGQMSARHIDLREQAPRKTKAKHG